MASNSYALDASDLLFSANRLLQPEPFSRRLRTFLEEAAAALGLTAIAVVELDATDGRIAPRWRAAVPSAVRPPPSLEAFEAWVGVPSRSPAPGEVGAAHGEVIVLPLTVRPALARRADAVAILVAPARPDPAAMTSLVATLERGLSADRRDRLAHTALTALEQAPDPIELTDTDARLVFANAAWEEAFGHPLPQAIGQTVGQLFRSRQLPVHDSVFYQSTMAKLHRGQSWLGALACRTGDEGRRFCEVNVGRYDAPEYGFRGHVAVRRDVAHRADRDHALAQAHHQFRAVLAALPEGVAVVRDDVIYFANAAFLTTVHRDEAGVIGMPYLSFVHPEDRFDPRELRSSQPHHIRMITARGSHRVAEIVVAGSVSFEGRPSMIVLSRDVTDTRIAQEKLAHAKRLSEMGQQAAGVAHEINNPLAYVNLNLELLKDRAGERLDAQSLEALREAIDGTKRIHRIVADLRGYTSADVPGPPEPVSVIKSATTALNIAHNQIRHRARLERDHEGALYVMAREGEIVQVLVSLLNNAAQAIPELDGEEHVIAIATGPTDEGEVRITVSDTGTGIPTDILPNLFDPFVTSKPRGEGSGLGLTIARGIIERSGGRIRVHTEAGRGTTFTITLPRAEPPHTPAPPVQRTEIPPTARRTAPSRTRVLIIDDEAPIARALRRVLARFDVTTLSDSHAALATLSAPGAYYDVVLCDLMMPGLPGSELYHQVSAKRPDLAARFVFMTGGAFTKVGSRFLDTFGSRVLVKPFAPSQVLRLIEEVAAEGLPRSTS